MAATGAIHEFLRVAHVHYTVVPHAAAFTAVAEAAATDVPSRDWAKVVVCFVDGEPIEAVVPAPFIVDLDRLLELTGGSEIRARIGGRAAEAVSALRSRGDAAFRAVIWPGRVRRCDTRLGA